MMAKTATVACDPAEGARSLWIDERYRSLFEANGLAGLDDLLASGGSFDLRKAGLPDWRRRIAVDLDAPRGKQRLYVKRYICPPAKIQMRRILGGHAWRSTAGVERHWISRLAADGIAVPPVVAFGERRRGLWERCSALALAEVPGESLESWAARQSSPAPREMTKALARFIRAFHRCGYVHRDLYLSHVFHTSDNASVPRFVLIDLQRVMHQPVRLRRWQRRDLAQLHYSTPTAVATAKDRLRWLNQYLEGAHLSRRQRRRLIRQVVRKAEAIGAHVRARRARLSERSGRT